jgi:hypothetical protein
MVIVSTQFQWRVQMGYDPDFYKTYRAYLEEKIVRENHDNVFRHFSGFTWPKALDVIDLGCGLREYAAYGDLRSYVGVDLNDAGWLKYRSGAQFRNADYRDVPSLKRMPGAPNAFISLFSTECCMSANDKYAFYESIFVTIPSVRYGLVGGFFYESRRDHETVGETGGIVSYQSIEDPSRYISPIFSEFRAHMYTPSEMFGDDVVEVWKIFCRR